MFLQFQGTTLTCLLIFLQDFIFPSGVGYPFGGKTPQYIVLEVHYDNPNLVAGNLDSSGYEFFYVDEEPTHRAGQQRTLLSMPCAQSNAPERWEANTLKFNFGLLFVSFPFFV